MRSFFSEFYLKKDLLPHTNSVFDFGFRRARLILLEIKQTLKKRIEGDNIYDYVFNKLF
jgi:hypothetical protein